MNVEETHSSLPNHPWFALCVRSRYEKSVACIAQARGFETFLPVYRARRRWSDRQKSVELPLLPGYVFCRTALQNRLPLLTIPGVIHVVSRGKNPVPMEDAELAAIKAAAQEALVAEPVPFLEVGQRVRAERGPMAGCEGILVEFRDRHRLVLSFSLLHRAIAVEVDRSWVEPIAPAPDTYKKASPGTAIDVALHGRAGGC